MATLDSDERALIEKDREENPGCFYSTALSQSCRSINGESKCEIIKKIFRQCPGKNKYVLTLTVLKEMISNRKEVTEDEHSSADGGQSVFGGDFFNRERMDPRKAEGNAGAPFGAFDPFRQREDEFDAQMSPFDFLRQEMLRPFESFFGGGMFGDGAGGGGFFSDMEKEFERMPVHPPSTFPRRPSGHPAPPQNPPHYSYQPSEKTERAKDAKQKANDQKDMFAGYKGRVDEI